MSKAKQVLYRLLPCFFFLPVLFSGCAALGPGIEQPTISVTDLRLQESRGIETVFLLELRVLNPNDFSLDIRGLNCELKIDGNRFATGISDVRREVPAFGTAVIPVSVYTSMIDMIGSVIEILQTRDRSGAAGHPLHYELAGKIRLAGMVNRTLPFHSRGEIDLTGQSR
jgi:LEA14-like dessication related protein